MHKVRMRDIKIKIKFEKYSRIVKIRNKQWNSNTKTENIQSNINCASVK